MVEVAALSYERKEKGGGEEEGETEGGQKGGNCEIAMLIRFQA